MRNITINFLYFLPVIIWCVLIFFRGYFWRCDQIFNQRATGALPSSVAVLIPARNESSTIGNVINSLNHQKISGNMKIIVIDDNSCDDTIQAAGVSANLKIIESGLPAEGWTGKLWALQQGISEADKIFPEAEFFLFSDADILHAPGSLNQLLLKAQAEELALVSLMVKLHCDSFWERLLIPPFIFFFQKLYPFRWVNDPRNNTVAAAGGCMLIRKANLQKSGGIFSIKESIIDDCALAKNISHTGKVWLGLSEETKSCRQYSNLSSIWETVARTAFVQINYSLINLFAVIIFMTVTYLCPPIFVAFSILIANCWVFSIGLGITAVMIFAFLPTIKYFKISKIWALTLPISSLFYIFMTISSAFQHLFGKGGSWKGRNYPKNYS